MSWFAGLVDRVEVEEGSRPVRYTCTVCGYSVNYWHEYESHWWFVHGSDEEAG